MSGHYPVSPQKRLEELSQSISQEEQADVYGTGESLGNFESQLAELFGKEDCVFLPSGTMAQVIALRIWSDRKNNPLVAFHPTCHLEIHEHKSYSELHQLQSILLGPKDNLFSLKDLESMKEKPSSVLIELPQREIGGQLPSWKELNDQIEYLKSLGINVHLDGARVWESTTYYKKSYSEIASLFDSVYISFYKGIGAIAGAALLGPKDFIDESKVWIRRHGGNLYTLYPLYLSARKCLEKRINNFPTYFEKAKSISDTLSKFDSIKINPETPQVNMFHIIFTGNKERLVNNALQVAKETGIWTFSNLKSIDEKNHKFECYIGDGALDLSNEEISAIFEKIIT